MRRELLSPGERGGILLTLLVFLAVIGGMAALTALATRAAGGAAAQSILSRRARAEVARDLFEQLSALPAGVAGGGCIEGRGDAGQIKLARVLCYQSGGEVSPEAKIIDGRLGVPDFPRLDLAVLFAGVTRCVGVPWGGGATLPSGWPISPDAVVAGELCEPGAPGHPILVRGNLSGAEVVTTSGERAVLGATGFIDLERVIVRGPTMIVAGGDLRIGELRGEVSAIPVTLVSATGVIIVAGVGGGPAVSATGWGGVFLPPGILTAPARLTPPMRRFEVQGIRRREE